MNKKIFYIDMDNTTNDFTSHYINYYNMIYKQDIFLKREDLIRYHLASLFPNLTEEEALHVRDYIFDLPEFWQTLPVLPHSQTVLKWLHGLGHKILFVSAPWPNYLDCGKDKLVWVKEHFPFIEMKDVIFTHHKHLLDKEGIMFDDSPSYLEDYKGHKVAMDYPFNRDIKVDGRVKDWYEFEKYLQEEVL